MEMPKWCHSMVQQSTQQEQLIIHIHDTGEFYPSITDEHLHKAIKFADNFTTRNK